MDIDEIFELLNEQNSDAIQHIGIENAQHVKTVSVFVQPVSEKIGMEVWENCAKVLSSRTDQELKPILYKLLCWLKDTTMPGAITIAKRLHSYNRDDYFSMILRIAMRTAQEQNDQDWFQDIEQFVIRGDFSCFEQ